MKQNLITKIKKANLVGRGGAEFPTALKWELAKKAKGRPKYVVSNASEGEIGLFKDLYILKHSPGKIFEGMALAMDYLGTREAYFNFNKKYYLLVKLKIKSLIRKYKKRGYNFTVYQEHPSYIGGEETALLNAIEGKRVQPRLKPPYPAEAGLFGKPTLVHNIETLFNVACVADGSYEHKRFYCISGEGRHQGVYHLPENWNLQKILEHINHVPEFDFFVQIGGSASGLILNQNQLKNHKMIGAGSMEIYPASTKPWDLLLKWFKFYAEESCGKCTPCREGTYQLYELIKNNKKIPWKKVLEIINTMEKTSLCGLGTSIGVPVRSYLANVIRKRG